MRQAVRMMSLWMCLIASGLLAETVVSTVSIPSGTPAVNPVTNKVYVTHNSTSISVVDGRTQQVTTLTASFSANGLAVNAVTNRIYLLHPGNDCVSVIDGATDTFIGSPITVGTNPTSIAVNPDTNTIYVANQDSNTVSVISGQTSTVTTTISTNIGTTPFCIAVNPVTNRIYTANFATSTVSIIDGNTNTASAVNVSTNPVSLVVNPVTNRTWVVGRANTVQSIDGSNTVSAAVALGVSITIVNIAINTVTNKLYIPADGTTSLAVVDCNTSTVSLKGGIGTTRSAIVNQNTNRVYVTSAGASNLIVVDGSNDTTSTLAIGGTPSLATVNPLTNLVYISTAAPGLSVVTGDSSQTNTIPGLSNPTQAALDIARNRLYVVSGNELIVANGADNSFVRVSLGASGNAIAVNSVFNKIYVGVANGILEVDGYSSVVNPINLGIAGFVLATNSNTNKIYVSDGLTLKVVDGQTTNVLKTHALNSCVAIEVNLVTNAAYCATSYTNATGTPETYSVIDGVTDNKTDVQLGGAIRTTSAIGINSATNRIYVACYNTDNVEVFDGATNNKITTIALAAGAGPQHVAVNTVTNRIYAVNRLNNTVSIINGTNNAIVSSPGVLNAPFQAAVNPFTNRIYVAAGNGVSVINGFSNTATNVTIGSPDALVLNASNGTAYLPNGTANTVTVLTSNNSSSTIAAPAIEPLTNDVSASATPTFTVLSNTNVYFQVDSKHGTWTRATLSNGVYTATVSALTPGPHTIYAVAMDQRASTLSTRQNAPYLGQIAAYEFFVQNAATVGLSGLTSTYDGSAKSVTATTNPAGLATSVQYDGSGTAPSSAGSYSVTAVITNKLYSGSASGTLNIAKATATISLSNLSQTYDGTAHSATVGVTPNSLTATVTYNGSLAAPTIAGDYEIVAVVNDANYTGQASGVFTINKATPNVSWSNPADIVSGTALSTTQLNATCPTPGSFTYFPEAGTVLGVGDAQDLYTVFTPNDSVNYATTSATVQLNVKASSNGTGGTNNPPVVSSGPTLSPASVIAGQLVQFAVSASDANNDTLSYVWDFGDGSTGTGSATNHTYSSPGVYTANVTISDSKGGSTVASIIFTVADAATGGGGGAGTNSDDSDGDGFSDSVELAAGTSAQNATDTPFGGQPAPAPIVLPDVKLNIKLNFGKKNSDAISLSGTLLLTNDLSGKTLIVDVGGVARAFTLNNTGSGTNGTDAASIKAKGSGPRTGKLSIKLTKGSFDLSAAGLTNESVTKDVKVPLTLLFDGKVYGKSQSQSYKATAGKSGATKDRK